MKKILLILLFLFAIANAQFFDKIIYFDYNKTSDGSFEESVSVFYQPFLRSYMFVNDPLDQHIRMQADRLLYYYPDKNIAIYMNNPDALIATIPVQLFVNTGSEDLGLSNMNFELTDYEISRDSLIRTWEAKGKKKEEYLKIDVFSDHENVYKTLSYDADGKLIKSVCYGKWKNISNYSFPCNIVISEEGVSKEFNFSNVKLLKELPDSISGLFDLPDDCEIHEYKF